MASLTQWTWIWINSGSWWWTGRLVCCGSLGCKESDTTERLNWTELGGGGSLSHAVYCRLWIASLDVFTLKVKFTTGSPVDWACESDFWGHLVYRDQATQSFFFLNSEYPDQGNKEQVVDTAWSEQLYVLTPTCLSFHRSAYHPRRKTDLCLGPEHVLEQELNSGSLRVPCVE